MGKWFKCSSCFYDIFFIYTIIVNKELNVFVHLILCKKSCFSDCYPPLILECVAGMFVVSKVSENMWCKLFSSLRKNDDENYYYYYNHEEDDNNGGNSDDADDDNDDDNELWLLLLDCPIYHTPDRSASEKHNKKKQKNEKSLNKSPRAAWPSMVCPGPVWHVLFWFVVLHLPVSTLTLTVFFFPFSLICCRWFCLEQMFGIFSLNRGALLVQPVGHSFFYPIIVKSEQYWGILMV